MRHLYLQTVGLDRNFVAFLMEIAFLKNRKKEKYTHQD